MKPALYILVVIVISVLLVRLSMAQGLNPISLEVLESMRSVTSNADLVALAPRFSKLAGKQILWRDAAAIARSNLGREPAGRAAIVRLLQLAFLLERGEYSNSPEASNAGLVDTLTSEDLVYLKRVTRFPSDRDAINYLLNRKPSLQTSPSGGEYTAIRLAVNSAQRLVLERSTTPYLDLGPSWSKTWLDQNTDIVKVDANEYGQTRRFQLNYLPDIVLAAKAFRIAEHSPPQGKAYAFYIATEAFSNALKGIGLQAIEGGETGLSIWVLRQQALDLINAIPDDSMLAILAVELQTKIPGSAFFARAFQNAAEAYKNASHGEPERRLWAAWGEGISYFAAGDLDSSAIAFDRMTPLFSIAKGAERYAYIFITFLAQLPTNVRSSLGNLVAVKSAAEKKLEKVQLDLDQMLTLDLDFAQIMVNIGRTDLGLKFIMQRLEKLETLPNLREKYEKRYLWELGAFARDLYYDISWELSSEGHWKTRPTFGYRVELDFLHNLKDGKLVGPGEIVTLLSGRPYGMMSPEEDCATVFAVYGVISESSATPSLLSSSNSLIKHPSVHGITNWAIAARDRKTPSPSLAPLLKVIWVEWFSQQFEPLKLQDKKAHEFAYEPLNVSGIADPEKVKALKNHPAATEHQKELIDMFISVRTFLERRYSR